VGSQPTAVAPDFQKTLCLCVSVFQNTTRGLWKHRGTEDTESWCERYIGKAEFATRDRSSDQQEGPVPSGQIPKRLCVSVPLCFKFSDRRKKIHGATEFVSGQVPRTNSLSVCSVLRPGRRQTMTPSIISITIRSTC
jgi:hypothetical protein